MTPAPAPDATPRTVALTPGEYLKARRWLAGRTVEDVAHVLSTLPSTSEIARTEWLRLIEADAMPATFSTIVALATVYPIDLHVLERLDRIQQGSDERRPAVCADCGSTSADRQFYRFLLDSAVPFNGTVSSGCPACAWRKAQP